MRAVSPGRAAVRDMAADDGRHWVALAEKFLDRADSVAPPSGCVAEECPRWLMTATRALQPAKPRSAAQERSMGLRGGSDR